MIDEQAYLEEMRSLYGPEAKHSDYQRGEHITYTDEHGRQKSGEILWVQEHGHTPLSGRAIPVTYICESGHGWPDYVYAGEVLQDTAHLD